MRFWLRHAINGEIGCLQNANTPNVRRTIANVTKKGPAAPVSLSVNLSMLRKHRKTQFAHHIRALKSSRGDEDDAGKET